MPNSSFTSDPSLIGFSPTMKGDLLSDSEHSATHLFANIRPRVKTNQTVHIRRVIPPGTGQILVVKNQDVQPHDLIGKTSVTAGFISINIAKKLGVSPSEASKFLQRPLGGNIFKGELLAQKKGLLGQKVIIAPTDGTLEFYDSKKGDLRLKFLPKELPVTSGVFGVIDEIKPDSGEVFIKTNVTEILGIVGSGIERSGILKIMTDASSLVSVNQIQPEMSQQTLVTGSLIYGDALRKAVGYGVQGIITGGVNARDFKSMVGTLYADNTLGGDVGISIVATEGFGPLPIGADIFEILKQYEGKFIIINGNTNRVILPTATSDSILNLRKIALPLEKVSYSRPEITFGEIKPNSKVRIIWPPFMGFQGSVIGIDQMPTVLKSGVATFLLTIETTKQKIKVPFTNVELI